MHYQDIEHNQIKKYTDDSIQWCDREHKSLPVLKEEIYNPYQVIQIKYKPIYQEETYNPYQVIHLKNKPKYEEEEYYSRDYGDIDFYKWLSHQNQSCVAI